MDKDTVRELLAHNTWANDRVLETVGGLEAGLFTRSVGGSFPSLQATLTHILWAEWLWLERWKGGSPQSVFAPEDFPSVSALRGEWRKVQAEQRAFVQALDDAGLGMAVSYVNLKGETWRYRLWYQIYHMVEHSAYPGARSRRSCGFLATGAAPRTSSYSEMRKPARTRMWRGKEEQ